MATPPTLSMVQFTAAGTWDGPATARDVTGVTWASGALIVIKGNTEDSTVTLTNPTNANLTISAVAGFPSTTASQSKEYAWTATAGSSQSGQTIAGSANGTGTGGYVVEVWSAHNGVGTILTPGTVTNSTTVSRSITTANDNSALSCGMGDWSAAPVAGGTTPYGTNPGAATNETSAQLAGLYSYYHWYHADAGTAGAKTIQVTSSASIDPMLWALEILGPVQELLPDADTITTGWTATPLYSKLNDGSDATVVTATLA